MNQSNVIAAFLAVAFVVFITMRGELGVYMGFFFGGGASPVAPANAPSSSAALPQSGGGSNLDYAQMGSAALDIGAVLL